MSEQTEANEQVIESVQEYTAEQFLAAYNELCEKMQHRVVVTPAYIARDDGSFSTVMQWSIGQMPKKENK